MSLGNADFRQLIPLLHPRTRVQDMDVLKAWYAAVADAIRPELPADLLALWIYAPGGEPILIEPEALEADHLDVPRAEPLANQMLLEDLEGRIRRAGYGSVLLRPIRHGGEDAGLLLLASAFVAVFNQADLKSSSQNLMLKARATVSSLDSFRYGLTALGVLNSLIDHEIKTHATA